MSRADDSARQRGYAHAFHERVINDILVRARGYSHRSQRHVPEGVHNGTPKALEIRKKIAENAQRRWEIGEAMKAEAGVVGHDLTGERDGGIAWTDRARILAPAGENRVQLATLAHECGHVFLHSRGSAGASLPGHVKEMEAECYAHQAFAAYGMRMPRQITHWGRHYVGQWVENDRIAGIPIDPRAVAYANGSMSPYDRLRSVPATWTSDRRSSLFGIAWRRSTRAAAPDPGAVRDRLKRAAAWAPWLRHARSLRADAIATCGYLFHNLLFGWLLGTAGFFVLNLYGHLPPGMIDENSQISASGYVVRTVGALIWCLIAMLWWTRPGALDKRKP